MSSNVLSALLKESTYKLTQFDEKTISALESNITNDTNKNKVYVTCYKRKKQIELKPEEVIRQLMLIKLVHDYGYSLDNIQVEQEITFGREKKRADIVVFDKNHANSPYIIVEVKKPKLKDGKEQLKSYCNATGAPIGVWTNGDSISYYHRKDPNYFEDINSIPKASQKLTDILTERWTIETLVKKDKWEGVFASDDKIQLTPSHLAICLSSLQDVKLFNSNLEVVDEAFEYLISKTSKGEKGQYFTPRYVIDMCVKMLNPNSKEKIIDTACGSCGFPVHTIFYVWEKILKQKGIIKSHLFTTEEKPAECTDYVKDNVFAIDFDEKTVRVGRTLNLIAGDGQTNVLHLNTLDFSRWDDKVKEESWLDIYSEGWKKLKKLRKDSKSNSNRDFKFDIVMGNPPFAGDIKEGEILSKYELAKKVSFKKQKNPAKNVTIIDSSLSFSDALNNPDCIFKHDGNYYKAEIKQSSNVGRDVLFIERNLDFLKPGGRMAIVLPQGRFNNASDQYIRDYIADKCRILAVVGLHGNVFKPHTGTKTSVLFVQKWDEEFCPKVDDYNIFFATMQEPSKDNSGDKIYVVKDDKPLLDSHGHLIVKHDLFNHEGLTQDGIVEAFIEFAKKEKLSFVNF